LNATEISAQGEYGGSKSAFISGNIIVNLFYNQKDSTLLVLTGSGLSYTKLSPGSNSTVDWYNFGPGNFQKDLNFGTAITGDSTLLIAGYGKKDDNINGGQVYYKNKGENKFHIYDPKFRDDEHLRGPYYLHIMDTTLYVSMVTGTMLKNKVPPDNSLWRAVLINKTTDFQNLIKDEDSLQHMLTRIRDSIHHYDTLNLSDSMHFARFDSLLKGDSLFASLHRHSFTQDSDSVFIDWETYSLDSTNTLKKQSLTRHSLLSGLPLQLIFLADSVILQDIDTLGMFVDTMWHNYDSIVYEIPTTKYPPDDYGQSMTFEFYILSINSIDSILFLGTTADLLVSTDGNRTFKGGFEGEEGSPLLQDDGHVQGISEVYINKSKLDSFRVFLITLSDTIAFSGNIENSEVDSTGLELVHRDSLKKWYVLDTRYGPTDMAFYNDTVFVSYNNLEGLFKFYQVDTLKDTAKDTTKVWKSKEISISSFLEPQLGINTITVVPVSDTSYNIWAGTDDGLYHLRFGRKTWDYYEYKRPFEDFHGETYAYPTVIRPGYKSAKIAYKLDEDAEVTIEVYDFSMRKVRTIIENKRRRADFRSDNSITDRWDGRDDIGRPVSPGVYYYKVSTDNKAMFGKIVVFGAKDF
jgi:hypothetical protein